MHPTGRVLFEMESETMSASLSSIRVRLTDHPALAVLPRRIVEQLTLSSDHIGHRWDVAIDGPNIACDVEIQLTRGT